MKTITQLLLLFACTMAGYSQSVAYFDFGNKTTPTKGLNYNNVVNDTTEQVGILVNVIDSTGASTGITLTVDDPFHGKNTAGTLDPVEGLPFSKDATRDSFYGEAVEFEGVTQPTGGFILQGLNPDLTYSFEIFASRSSQPNENREALYTISGFDNQTKTAVLDAANNTSEVAEIMDVQPTADGTLTFTAEAGENNNTPNKFYYLGAIRLEASGKLSVNSPALSNSLAVYPNPVSNRAQITFNLKEQSNIKIDIYDLSGRLVENIVNGEQPAGKFSKAWNRSSNIASGVYILQIDANGKRSTSKLLLK